MREIQERLSEKIFINENGCWLWKGFVNNLNYGRFNVNGIIKQAHRVVYELLESRIKPGLVLDHLCSVRNCVNPNHLEPVSQAENNRRAAKKIIPRKFCVKGHEYTKQNTRINKLGHRGCKKCNKEYVKKYQKTDKYKNTNKVYRNTLSYKLSQHKYYLKRKEKLLCHHTDK